jgi:hypothetical protein
VGAKLILSAGMASTSAVISRSAFRNWASKTCPTVRRIINQDGTFNVRRNGTTLRDFHPYLQLINMSWAGFLATLLLAFIVINSLFASVYFLMPTDQLSGIEASSSLRRFLGDFFFSSHTLTTVGYGNIAPAGLEANVLASSSPCWGCWVSRWRPASCSDAFRGLRRASDSARTCW